jgi:AraC-like DNA-binding protein
MNMSARTLARRLEKEETSFREIVTYARLSEAERLLLDTDKPIADISTQVGFSCRRSFERAFIRLKDISPAQFRNEPKHEVLITS